MLEGDIRVGRQLIGTWHATRRTDHADVVPNLYECIYWQQSRKPNQSKRWTFMIEHTPADGAVSLASAVLASVPEAAKVIIAEERFIV